MRGNILLSRRSFLHRHRTTCRTAIFFAADTDNNRAFVSDSVRVEHRDIQSPTFAEFIDWNCVAGNVSAAFHVDISTTMVYVANLLRFCGRNGDFYIFDELADNFSVANDDLRAKFDILADTAGRTDLLLHDVALSVAGVANGTLFDELARIARIYPRDDRNSANYRNFFADWDFIASDVQISREIFTENRI